MAKSSDFDPLVASDPMLKLVDDFLDRTQRGEQPTIDEYCQKHPDLAEEIRDLFPALVVIEDLQPASCDWEVTSENEQDIPEKIGDYRILGELGRGGMGVVYEAEQESLGRRVALKVLPHQPHLSGNARLRFLQEARAAAKMHHTNIVPVFEVGEDGNHVFYAMQLILGQSLDHIIKELKHTGSGNRIGKLGQPPSSAGAASSGSNHSSSSIVRESLSETSNSKRRHFYRSVAKIGMQVADALAFAHARGVIHRDIKPSNLLLDAEGVVWVTDFGLAKIEDEGLTHAPLTTTGDFLGTLRYMSPERFQGKCDVRADIYALGLTLYELLLQRPAFGASDRLKLIQWINEATPVKPRSIDPRIPRDLETIILKSIEKEPKRRYKSAKALEQDLGRFLSDEPIQARRISLAEHAVRWARRNKGLATALVSIAALLLVLLVGSTMVAVQQSNLRKTAEVARNVAEQARVEAEEARSFVERNLYFSQMNFAGKMIGQASGTNEIKTITDAWLPTPATVSLTPVSSGPVSSLSGSSSSDLRGWEWYYLRTYANEKVLSLATSRPSIPLDAVWSPDQTRVATAQLDHTICIWNSSTGKLLQTLKGHPNIVVALSWNPQEKRLAACDDENNIWVWDLETGQTVRRFKAPQDALVEQVAWDRAGNQLAWSSNSSVFVWNREKNDEKPIELRGGPSVITSLQWSPDGTHLAGSGWRQRKSVLWDVVHQKVSKEKFDATLIKWSREGHRLEGWLLATLTGEIQWFRANVDTPIRTFLGHTSMARFLSWGPKGKWFVSASADQTVRVWEIESGRQVRAFQGHLAEVFTARLNRDRSQIVSTSRDKTAKIWTVKTPQKKTLQTSAALEARETLQDRPEICSLDWHPDGTRLATVGWDGLLRVWDTTTSQLLLQDTQLPMQDNSRRVETVRWSPDGKWLAMDELEGAGLNSDSEKYLGEEYLSEDPGMAILREWGSSAERRTVLVPHPQRCNGVAWSPDAECFATVCNDKKVRIWAFAPGTAEERNARLPTELSVYSGHQSRPGDIQWNPRKKDVIATCDERGVIKIWDTAGERWTLAGHRGMIHQLSWSPDGEFLASAGQDGTVRIWSLESGQQVKVLAGHHNVVLSVDWSPLGARIATGSRDSTVKIWEPFSGTEALSLSHHRGAVLSVAWSRDGTRLATADITGDIVIWDASEAYHEAAVSTP